MKFMLINILYCMTPFFLILFEVFLLLLGVAPFPGATTGTGGRIRDNHATGIGAHVIAASAGYCFGNLNIPGSNTHLQMLFSEFPFLT